MPPRPVSLAEVLALAKRLGRDSDDPVPFVIRTEDIERLGEHDASLFWALVRKALLRSLDS
jgi:hypothetical protein